MSTSSSQELKSGGEIHPVTDNIINLISSDSEGTSEESKSSGKIQLVTDYINLVSPDSEGTSEESKSGGEIQPVADNINLISSDSEGTSEESKSGGEIQPVADNINLISSNSEGTSEGNNKVVESAIEPLPAYQLVYLEKSYALLKQLEDLHNGTHLGYVKGVENLESVRNNELSKNHTEMLYNCETVEREYENDCRKIIEENEKKEKELKDKMIAGLNEEKKAIVAEEEMMKLQPICGDEIPLPTRKLRRRPHKLVVSAAQEKRRKLPPLTSNFYMLNDFEIEEDVKAIKNSLNSNESISKPELLPSCSTDMNPPEVNDPERTISNIRIESGKLLYDKRWYHRGQPVFVKKMLMDKFPAVIVSIKNDIIWVKNMLDSSKFCINLSCLLNGEVSITRRAVC